ncbi:MAG: MMPL family transporter [Bacteroidales bacterium]|nr:MMPL family transporter [Bacteroidales bacterium]
MKKIDFAGLLVKKRLIFMLSAFAIAIFCILLIPRTNINSNMAHYLPDDSQMKHGIELMTEEAGDDGLGSGMIRVMFLSLPDSLRSSTKDKLSKIEGISSVIYIGGSEEYNHGDTVLYEILGNGKYSQHDLAKEIRATFNESAIVETSEAETTAPTSVMLIALVLLVSVLLIMCESWLEPPIFLVAIGVGVAINMGTNALLESVSATTNSIASILQLVLSIDYSIILMNRYRQEKSNGGDKTDAMSRALKRAASPILSSAFTTIVGLLALVFMKLKIGADMGIVLAKGVLCSLVAIFTVLPWIVLALDNPIEKAKKRVLNFHTERLAGFSMKFRIPLAIGFATIFTGAYLLHKHTDISFMAKQKSVISEVFPQKNITVLMYENSDSLQIISISDTLSKNPHIKSFISYPSLMQKKHSAREIKAMVENMASLATENNSGFDLNSIDPNLIINAIYYIGAGKLAEEKIGIHDFAILLSKLTADSTLTANIDTSTDTTENFAEKLGILVSLTDTSITNNKLSPEEISELLGIDTELITLICPRGSKMTMREVISTSREFINSSIVVANEVSHPHETTSAQTVQSDSNEKITEENTVDSQSEEHVAHIDDNDKIYTDTIAIRQQYSSAEIAQIIGMKEKSASLIYTLYGRNKGTKVKTMSLYEFICFINHDLSKRKIFASQVDEESRKWLTHKEELMFNALNAKTEETIEEEKTIETNEYQVETYTEDDEPIDAIGFSMPVIDTETLAMLDKAERIMDIADEDSTFSAKEMHNLFASLDNEVKIDDIELAYLYYGCQNFDDDNIKMSAEDIIGVVNDSIVDNPKFATIVNDEMKNEMAKLDATIDENLGRLRGGRFSQTIIFSDYPTESDETDDFVTSLSEICNNNLRGEHYLIGESVMMHEMRNQFDYEMLLVTLITVLSIFLIVAITFRSLAVPAILVMTVMSAVYINVYLSGLNGELLYLAYLIMQSILMGATIDYGILFTSNYREARSSMNIGNSLRSAYRLSTHTIFTSGMIMTLAPLAMSLMLDDPTTIMILQCIAAGAFAAVLLIVFVLPGLLAAFDRFIVKKTKDIEATE